MKFRSGQVDDEVIERIDIAELYNDLEHGVAELRTVVNEDGEEYEIAEVARDPHLFRARDGEPEGLYFRYVVRNLEDYESIGDDGYDETRQYEPRNVTDFLLMETGDMAYEAGGSPRGPLGFLLDEGNPSPLYQAGMTLPRDVLDEHYHDADRVTTVSLSFEDLSPDDQPDATDSSGRGVPQMATIAENSTISVGHYHDSRDLRESDLINEIVDQGAVDTISAVHGGRRSLKLSEAGWIEFHLPEDTGARERANVIRNRVTTLF
jgi:hypothetical protein